MEYLNFLSFVIFVMCVEKDDKNEKFQKPETQVDVLCFFFHLKYFVFCENHVPHVLFLYWEEYVNV